jgi:acetyl esterase/lipase
MALLTASSPRSTRRARQAEQAFDDIEDAPTRRPKAGRKTKASSSSVSSVRLPSAYTRHYYASADNGSGLFEQSLDIYHPIKPFSSSSSPSSKLPLFVVVVGSGWLGHQPMIYLGTSLFNASCPRTIAATGATCVAIRHRGAFPAVDYQLVTGLSAVMGVAVPAALAAVPAAIAAFPAVLAAFSPIVSNFVPQIIDLLPSSMIVTGLLFSTIAFAALSLMWSLLASGSAEFDDMLHDVASAIKYLQSNNEQLGIDIDPLQNSRSHVNDEDKEGGPSAPFVLGGYSSGGHVLSSLLFRPDILEQHGLPSNPIDLCRGVLLISPVLAVKTIVGAASASYSWFTDLVVSRVWGDEKKNDVPSPFHSLLASNNTRSVNKHKDLKGRRDDELLPPHLIVGCEQETFGIPLLDTFFCSEQYASALVSGGTECTSVVVSANHWTVLESAEMFTKLGAVLGGGWPLLKK